MNDLQKTQIQKLRTTGYSCNAISAATGISLNTVKSYCRRNNITGPENPPKDLPELHFCKNCGQPLIMPARKCNKLFCSDECRFTWWSEHRDKKQKMTWYTVTCAYCGKTFQVYGDNRRKYCCHPCYIAGRFNKKCNEFGDTKGCYTPSSE